MLQVYRLKISSLIEHETARFTIKESVSAFKSLYIKGNQPLPDNRRLKHGLQYATNLETLEMLMINIAIKCNPLICDKKYYNCTILIAVLIILLLL
jgi:hypothetical protein